MSNKIKLVAACAAVLTTMIVYKILWDKKHEEKPNSGSDPNLN